MSEKEKTPPPRRLEHRKLAELVPYAKNARTHSTQQVAEIVASIQEFGWTNPVLVDGSDLVAGHGRVLAAEAIYKTGGTIRYPDGTAIPPHTVPVLSCSGWSEKQRRAYILADNKLALNADWDFSMLTEELAALRDEDVDLSVLGFGDAELKHLGVLDAGTDPAQQGKPYQPQYQVLIECADEHAQTSVIKRLVEQGIECRALLR